MVSAMGRTPHDDAPRMQRTSDAETWSVLHDEGVTPGDRATTAARVTHLIELGRDREAAELATATGGTMDPRTQLDEIGPLLAGVVGNIDPEQLDLPTPCADFTVRGVLQHMIGGATAFTAAFNGESPGVAETTDVLAGFGPALGALAEAVNRPDALDQTIDAPFGPTPGEAFARFIALDGLVHGWDLAVATGQLYEPSDRLVADVESFARQAVDPLRDGDTFQDAAPAPADAAPIERLAAFTGRSLA
jgi:uncharacterized protein (TIGR03086 family)